MAVTQSIWKMAFRNLTNQNTTTILTVAAIAVCVMTFVSIFSILDGLQLTIQGVMDRYYGDRKVFVLTSASSAHFHESALPRTVADDYRDMPEVYALSEEALVEVLYQGTEVDLLGADLEDLSEIYFFQSLEGRMLGAPGECLAGITAARTLGIQPGMDLNLEVEGRTLGIQAVGVFETKTPLDALIVVDREYLSSQIHRFSANSSILRLRVVASEDLDAISTFTLENHPELKINEARQVSKFFEKSIINISRLLSTIIIFVILLMVMGIYNSMNMVVSERSREIGIIRAMGARRTFVLRLFIAESAFLAFLGGLFGVALGVAMSHAITSFFSIFVPGSLSVAPLTKIATIGWGLTASLSIGLIGGIFPANRASRVEISEALSEG
jgi:putative ABC transport system permease protein